MKSVRNLSNKTNNRTRLSAKSKKKGKSIQRKNNLKVYECPFCMKKFPNIKQHIENMHPETEENPSHVEKNESKQEKEVLIKNKKAKGTKRIECKFCKKLVRNLTHLKEHERIHTGDKPFHCIFCNKSFSRLQNLRQHKRIHTGEKSFNCSICNKSFARISNLTQHKDSHTGEKNYACTFCDKIFRLIQFRHMSK